MREFKLLILHIVDHNLAKDTTLKGPGNIDRYLNVNYPVSNDQIEALVTTAGQCRQYVSVRCYEMSTFSGQYWWKSRQGYDMANWGGAPTNSSKCACALSKNCAGGRQCNCNSNDGVWRSDSGYLEDSAYLPVSSLHIYDLDDSSEQSVVTLGKLQCSGAKDACTFNNGNCAHSCTAIGEQAVCSCRDGYVLAGDKFGCLDVDECSSFNGGCDHVCSNTMGGFQCSCRTGFTLDINGFTCTDNDECTLNKGNCSHTCSNTEGSYRCSCPTGYTLGSDLHTCQDVNECHIGNGGCDHYCTNSQGSYSCSCRPGYKLDSDGHTCLEYMSKYTTKTCECRLRAEPPHTGLGTHLYDLTTLIYGETQLWASDDGGQSVYSVLNRFPNFYATHKRQTTGYPAAASDVDCVKVFQNCPRDCVRMTRLILGKEKLGMKVAGEVFGRLTNTTLGQNMCDKLRREIDSPGRTIAITYDPHACGNEVVTYPLSQRLCCTLVPSPVGHLLAWNSMCEDGDTFSIGNIIG
ncbi:signal peptide, CUB and EGF-like domain-containing protein 2 [Lingula anatina]|uniref:Signal peptide, CUB and EGF-like domain-containing protein 2 n=1 Tax=Lingula anatina TaxID=7574 RepID=A0A1S3IEF7_LINAN|nr:signal peptide, CUB and EGF-like domain-containing protein 2 [Lingula anatina]|eukprot:XP_013396241.1 signal peptide, CUB and EGF-like domain-containing protein 2 [Lingula anatina]